VTDARLRAIMVSVDYSDILGITLPYNRHHFSEVVIVTTPEDVKTQEVAISHGANTFLTRSFYESGALFNKWKCLEQGLDAMGRHGWFCVMDADVLWPEVIPAFPVQIGKLYTPRRRMVNDIRGFLIPPENDWHKFPIHPQQAEFAGYSQIFHADDPHLGPAPWHQTNWKHAGGADSFFQAKWSPQFKERPPFEVLHLGPAGVNWCGRASAYVDGTINPDADGRQRRVRDFIKRRHRGPTCYDHERIR
jgi:hypothetical protein